DVAHRQSRGQEREVERRVAPAPADGKRADPGAERREQARDDRDDALVLVPPRERDDVRGVLPVDANRTVVAVGKERRKLAAQCERARDDEELGATVERRLEQRAKPRALLARRVSTAQR